MSAENPCGKGSAESSNDSRVDNSAECPTCGNEYKNESAVKIHHAKIHNESIAGVEVDCSWCGETLRRRKYRVEKFDEQFCGEGCQGEYYDEHMEGENSLRWEGGKEERDCQMCGSSFKEWPGRDTKYCSRECHGKGTSQRQSGEGHPNWKGGKVNYYGRNWPQQRKKALQRDQYRCQRCLTGVNELKRQPDVHHIRRIKWFKKNYDAPEWYEKGNELENLVCFCHSCHQKWEGIPLRPQ